MPDICLCHGGKCPLRDSCKRHLIEPDPVHQSYFFNPPFRIHKTRTQCLVYIPTVAREST